MDNLDLEVLRQIALWRAASHAVLLATVTRTWGSAPRPIGSLMALRDDGHICGSVSGGCIEDDLIAQLRSGALALHAPPHLLRYGVTAQAAQRFGLPCGGSLELLIESVQTHTRIDSLIERLQNGERVTRHLDRQTAAVKLVSAQAHDQLVLSDTVLQSVHGPSWRLLVIGAGQMSLYLAEFAKALGFQVLLCDPRQEYAQPATPIERTFAMPDDAVQQFAPDAHSAIVALTHDPKLDDLALMEALRSPAYYVGAIGSKANQAKRRARLAEHFELSQAQLARLHGPVGLNIGARTPSEIALSILAEMTAKRHGLSLTASPFQPKVST